MATIPRVSFDRPSGAPSGGGGGPTANDAFAEAAASVGDLASFVGGEFAKEERAEALKHRAATEALQAIANQVDAGKRVGDFEEDGVGVGADIREKFIDTPELAVDEYTTILREMIDREVELAPNADTGLQVARGVSGRAATLLRGMRNWAIGRQTQKTKTDLTTRENQVQNAAGFMPTEEAYGAHMELNQAELTAPFDNVYGKAAPKKMAELRSKSAESFIWGLMESDNAGPVVAMQVLNQTSGPVFDHLDATTRRSLLKDARSSLLNWGKLKLGKTLRDANGVGKDLTDAYLDNSLDDRVLLSRERANAEQQKTILLDERYTPEQRSEQLAVLKTEASVIESIGIIKRQGLPFDAEDDPVIVAKMWQDVKELAKKKGSPKENLLFMQKFHENFLLAARGKKVGAASASSLLKTFSQALPKAIEAQARDTWHFDWPWKAWRDPYEAGNNELEIRREGDFKATSEAEWNRVHQVYADKINAANDGIGIVTPENGIKFSLEAITAVTGKPVKARR